MLNQFRNSMKGIVAWVIGILIILSMAVVGVPALENFGGSSAITVGGVSYSARDLELELRDQVQAIQIENPNISRDQLLAQGLGTQAVEILVTRALIENEAENLGMTVPSSVIREFIEGIEGFRNPETGRFDNSRLALLLQQRGLDYESFGELIAQDVLRTQIVEAITTQSAAPEELTRLLLLREFEQRDLAVATLPVAAATTEPTEEELVSYLGINQDRYMSPEYRTFTVLTIREGDVTEGIEVPEEDVQRLFDIRQAAVAATETRSYRQFRVTDAQALEELTRLLGEGAGFDALAEAAGADVTALEDQSRDDIINEDLAEAIFAAESGAVAGPVETPFGTLVAEVTAISGAAEVTFDDLKAELEAELRAEIAADRIAELVESVEVARDEGATLSEAAQVVGIEATTTQPVDRELFTRSGSIANVPGILNAEGLSLEEGEESQALRLDDGYGFIAVDRITPPRPLPLSEVRDTVERAYLAERLENASDEISARLAALEAEGRSFNDAVAELGGTLTTATVTRSNPDPDVPQEALAIAFDAEVGSTATVPAASGENVYAVKITNVVFGDSSPLQGALPLVASQYGQQISAELNEAYLAALREETPVKQNAGQIARALGQGQE